MSRAEYSIQARNTALRGETVHVDTRSVPSTGNANEKGWSKVLGSFAAVYSDTPVRTEHVVPVSVDSPYRGDAGVATVEGRRDIRAAILGNLYKSFLPDDIASVTSFTDHDNLTAWTDTNLQEKLGVEFWEDGPVEPEDASMHVSDYLTRRGLGTLADKGTGAAVLLTEYLIDNPDFPNDQIRSTVAEQGYKLLLPSMSSQTNLEKFGDKLSERMISSSRGIVLDEAKSTLTLIDRHDKGKQVLYNAGKLAREGQFGCPVLHLQPTETESAQQLKEMFGVIVDTIWDPYLAPRVANPLPKSA